jgi:hypothetical protein
MTDALGAQEVWQLLGESRFVFHERPKPIVADLRVMWRLPTVLLALAYSRSRQSSAKRIHVLDWSVRTATSRRIISEALAGARHPGSIIVRFDPMVDRTMAFAMAEGLVLLQSNARLALTEKGLSFVQGVLRLEVLEDEKLALQRFGRELTEGWVANVTKVAVKRLQR